MIDLLVIGAGLSGLTVALSAARAGHNVRVIAKGMGAIHWQPATLDLLGYCPGNAQALHKPLEAIDGLPAQHPYRRLSTSTILSSFQSFVQSLNDAGLSYCGPKQDNANFLLPSPVGAVRPTFSAPQAQVGGDLGTSETRVAPMLIVGFSGMRDFYPHLIADNLCKQGYTARAELLPLSIISRSSDSNLVHLAESLDLPVHRHHLGAMLKRLVQSGERIGLPAILGLDQHPLTFSELQTQIGVPIFEIPTLPPSVPGIRLYRALRSELSKHNVRIEANMEVIGFHNEGKRIKWVETATSSRPLRHHAENFILATGGILGGGFSSDHTGKAWDVVFNLPLTTPQDRRQWFQSRFLDERGHPIFHGGIEVNQAWQPIDGNGAVIYENVRVVGGALAHADAIRERSLEGIAIATGSAAAAAIGGKG